MSDVHRALADDHANRAIEILDSPNRKWWSNSTVAAARYSEAGAHASLAVFHELRANHEEEK